MKTQILDSDTQKSLEALREFEKVHAEHVPNVRSVLIVLSAAGMAYDLSALRHLVTTSYPDAVVYFENTSGRPLGQKSAGVVDLLIDFTGPGQRQGLFHARGLIRRTHVSVGRNVGLFRKSIYDRVFDEKKQNLPREVTERERFVQKRVLELAGVAVAPVGTPTRDLEHEIALSLPPLRR